jgi:hypothetical protein
MNIKPMLIKKSLDNCIKKLTKVKDEFVKRPDKDFSRDRKITFPKLIEMLITMKNHSSNVELLKFFGITTGIPRASSLLEQRCKLKPKALLYLLQEFASTLKKPIKYRGYRLLAIDGTKVNIPTDPNNEETYVKANKNSKGYNLLNVNALYDVCNKIYLDVTIQTYRKLNEFSALVEMIKRSPLDKKVILIADRGYESYNNIAQLENKGWKYVIRVKASNIGKGLLSKVALPIGEEFDEIISILMTRQQTNEIKSKPWLYRFLAKHSTFEFLPNGNKDTYPLSFRVVCVKLSEDNFEYLITNLNDEFRLNDLREIYWSRWGVETSFRELKHTIGMTYFHSKKVDLIQQEIFASMILYNFCEMIILNVIIKQDNNRKYTYQVKFTEASFICFEFLVHCVKSKNQYPPKIEAVIAEYISPVRPGRNYPRNIKTQPAQSFFYRIA